jgi:hypothetical protein
MIQHVAQVFGSNLDNVRDNWENLPNIVAKEHAENQQLAQDLETTRTQLANVERAHQQAS